MSLTEMSRDNVRSIGTCDSLEDCLMALEAKGRLVRIKEMNRDKYQATGFAYRLEDEFGPERAPAFLIERVKVEGEWKEGQIIGNPFGSWSAKAMGFGIESHSDDQEELYRAVPERLETQMSVNPESVAVVMAVMRASANLTIVLNNLQRAFSKLRDQLELDC